MKSESDKLRDLMNIMEGKNINSTTLNEGPKWERFKTSAKAAFGNKNAQGAQKRQALAKKFEDAWETWLGQTGSTGTKEDLEDFLSTKAGFTLQDTNAIMGNISNNLLGSGGGRTEPRLGDNPPDDNPPSGGYGGSDDNNPPPPPPPPSGGSARPSSEPPQRSNSRSNRSYNTNPNEAGVSQAIADYQSKFKDLFQNSNGGRGLDNEALEQIADSAKRISTMFQSYKDKLSPEQLQDLKDLHDQANTMLVNGGFIEGDSHGFSSNDLDSSPRRSADSTSNNTRREPAPSTSNARPTFAPVNDNPNNGSRPIPEPANDTTGPRRRPPANDNPRESRIFEAEEPMNKEKVQQIFDKAAAYAFKKGLVGNPEYNNQGYNQNGYSQGGSQGYSGSQQAPAPAPRQSASDMSLRTKVADILSTHGGLSANDLNSLRSTVSRIDNYDDVESKNKEPLSRVGWAFLRSLGNR